ncbi:hypothetical protein D1O30_07240 [Methylocystis hirsuta]|uniref:Uncharacterized protein n=2 Tax=Methylocystis hirsuta TaxID=369798 RepID=A0A3M9XR92_9HYPH|nr:hypothetical protein D1O30_07240 [Methylocystis hirsuta]
MGYPTEATALRARIVELERRNQDLLEANNRYLERARTAEAKATQQGGRFPVVWPVPTKQPDEYQRPIDIYLAERVHVTNVPQTGAMAIHGQDAHGKPIKTSLITESVVAHDRPTSVFDVDGRDYRIISWKRMS